MPNCTLLTPRRSTTLWGQLISTPIDLLPRHGHSTGAWAGELSPFLASTTKLNFVTVHQKSKLKETEPCGGKTTRLLAPAVLLAHEVAAVWSKAGDEDLWPHEGLPGTGLGALHFCSQDFLSPPGALQLLGLGVNTSFLAGADVDLTRLTCSTI